MPGPATVEEFRQLVERAQIADRPVVQKAVAAWQAKGVPDDPGQFAQFLIETGVITPFHAEQLLAGRYKGFRVGAYRILRLIGVGGMGRVYLAEHAFMKRRVALKILPKSQNKEGSAIERFQREAQAVASLNHPNIVHAYDSGQEGDVYFLSMEYVAGESVQDYVKHYGRVAWPYAADFIRQAAEGLQHAADSGLVHRDIKPGNLLVDLAGTVKLLDLGLAMFFTEEIEGDPLTLRYNENVLGTADYLAPEQAVDSHNIDIRADIYSLGGTLYYLLTGQAPFPSGTIAQKLLWHQQKEPESVSSLAPDVPKALDAVLRKMMSKRPDDRYPTAAAVAAALAPFSKPHPQPFPPEAVQQYEAMAPRAGNRPPPPLPAALAPAPRPPASVQRPSPSAASAVLQRPNKPPSAVARLPRGVDSKPRSSTTIATAVPAVADSDAGLDFLRSGAPPAAPTKRDLPAAVTVAAKQPAPPRASRAATWVWGGATLVALGLMGGVVYFAVTGNRSNPNTPSTIFVHDRAAKDKTPSGPAKTESAATTGDVLVRTELDHKGPRSLAEALERSGRTSRIVLGIKPAGDWDVDPIAIGAGAFRNCEFVHMVGEKPTVTLSTQSPDQPLLRVSHTKGFVVKDLIFDGSGRASPLLVIEGEGVEGCRLENVVFQNFTGDAVQLLGVRGTKSAPVIVKNCTFKGTGPNSRGVVLAASPENPSPSKFVAVEDCRFLGCATGLAAIGAVGSAAVKRDIFASGGVGILFAPGAGVSLLEEFRVEKSTFWKTAAGVVLDDAPAVSGKIVVADSIFADVAAPPVSGPSGVVEKLRGKGSVEITGLWVNAASAPKDPAKNSPIGAAATVAPIEFQETDPLKSDFLRPKHAMAVQNGAARRPVGALPPVAD